MLPFLKKAIQNAILEDNKKKYYVGKLILDTKNINPATYLGFGTWTLWGAGRVPVGVDTTDTKFNTVEKTGGSNSVSIAHTHTVSGSTAGHTLTVSEIPAHKHRTRNIKGAAGGSTWSITTAGYSSSELNGDNIENTGGGQAHSHSVNLTSGSAGGSVSTVQEYITCYIWKRTA